VHSNKGKKLIRITLELTLLLTILNVSTPFIHATAWPSIPDTRITWDDNTDWAPSIAQAQDGRIWFVWHRTESGINADILYKVYNGSSTFPWSPTKKLTTDPDEDRMPSITTTADGNIWVVWSSNRNGNYDIYYKVYDGVSWSPYYNLTTDPNIDELPSIMQTDGTIWLTWSTNRTGNFDIFYKNSTNNGTTWSPDTPLPDPVAEDDRDPSIVETTDGEIWFVWSRNNDIYYKIYNGTDWSPDIPLTSDPDILDLYPSIMQASNGKIWVVWDSDRISDQSDIYYRIYDNSTGWSPDTRVTFYSTNDLAPSIMQDINGTIWIAWTSNRLSNFDIYYKTDSPPEHDYDVAIFSVTHDPNVTIASPGLIIYIEVVLQNQGAKSIFAQVECYVNSIQLGSSPIVHLSKGQLTLSNFEWNTSNVPPGTYTIIANASINDQTDTDPADNTFIDGEVYVKIPSDVNGDRIVDIFDIGSISAHWYPGPPEGPLGYAPEADLNDDGAVDIFDIGIVSANWGQS